MFSVTPSTGELRASKDNGTLFTIAYKPTFYGKTHRAKLLIQVRNFHSLESLPPRNLWKVRSVELGSCIIWERSGSPREALFSTNFLIFSLKNEGTCTYFIISHVLLFFQTREYQWIYDIKGETPEYAPPRAMAAIESHLSNTRFQRTNRKNYVRENLKIGSTAVSSPLKGAPLFAKLSP